MTSISPRLRTHSHILVVWVSKLLCVCVWVQKIGLRTLNVQYRKAHTIWIFRAGWLDKRLPPKSERHKDDTRAHSQHRLKKCMVHYSSLQNSWNWDKRFSNQVCVCVCVCVCARNQIRISHTYCQMQSMKTRSPYLNWNQFSFPCASWMQIQCIKPNRSLSWLMYGNLFVLFKQSTYLACVETPKNRWQTRSRTRKTETSEICRELAG